MFLQQSFDFHHKFRAQLISPSGQSTEKSIEELERVIEPANLSAGKTTDHLLFDFPAEPGLYRLSLTLESKEGDASIETVRVYVKALP